MTTTTAAVVDDNRGGYACGWCGSPDVELPEGHQLGACKRCNARLYWK